MPKKFSLKICFLVLTLTLIAYGSLQAATVEELRGQIDSHNAEIKKLDEAIARFRSEITKTRSEANSLKGEIEKLELAKKKLQTDIAVTQNKISVTNLNIQKLDQGIKTTAEKIEDNRRVIGAILRSVNNEEQASLAETLIGEPKISTLLTRIGNYQDLGAKLEKMINTLRQDKQNLEEDKGKKESEKQQLSSLASKLRDQNDITEQTKKTKDQLLTTTQNKESNYQKLLNEQIKKRDQVMAEMAKIEQELKYTLDPSSIPKKGKGVLGWPVDKVILTQGFGETAFSKSSQGQAVYNGNGHNGIDLGGAIGDLIYSAESGQVIGVGDTDTACKGASYGKWILIKHNNGLSTLYAHLSSIKVTEGQTVKAGQTIGYMGNTGYSTGPHLHFTVYASDGVKVSPLQSKVAGCGVYRLPLASYSAYLNPLSYL